MKQSYFPPEERLAILKAVDCERKWYALDDKRVCTICDRVFTGGQINIQKDHKRHSILAGTTPAWPSSITHWFLCEVSPALYQMDHNEAQSQFSLS